MTCNVGVYGGQLGCQLYICGCAHSPCLSKFHAIIVTFSVRSPADYRTASHSREVNTSRTRRVSISSTEDNLDLEASLPSFRVPLSHMFPAPVPEGEEPSSEPDVRRAGTGNGRSLGRSRSPTGRVRVLANKLRSSIASLGSPHTPVAGETIWTSKKNFATDTQLLFKRRITNLYVQVSALRSYVELNYSGFRKVLKK
jgi:phosphate transporter